MRLTFTLCSGVLGFGSDVDSSQTTLPARPSAAKLEKPLEASSAQQMSCGAVRLDPLQVRNRSQQIQSDLLAVFAITSHFTAAG